MGIRRVSESERIGDILPAVIEDIETRMKPRVIEHDSTGGHVRPLDKHFLALNHFALPESVAVMCPMFVGRPEMGVEIDLILISDGDRVMVRAKSAEAAVEKIKQVEAILKEVTDALPTAVVTLGKVQHQDWQYVKSDESPKVCPVPSSCPGLSTKKNY